MPYAALLPFLLPGMNNFAVKHTKCPKISKRIIRKPTKTICFILFSFVAFAKYSASCTSIIQQYVDAAILKGASSVTIPPGMYLYAEEEEKEDERRRKKSNEKKKGRKKEGERKEKKGGRKKRKNGKGN